MLALGATVYAAGNPFSPYQGGTGTSTLPAIGQVLVGQPNGTYAPQATSTLGISGGAGCTSTAGYIFYASSTGGCTGSSSFFWDFLNNRLGVGTSTGLTSTITVASSTGQSTALIEGQSASIGSSLTITDLTTAGNQYSALVNPSGASGANANTVPLSATFSTGGATTGGIIFASKPAAAPILFYVGGNSLAANEALKLFGRAVNIGTSTLNNSLLSIFGSQFLSGGFLDSSSATGTLGQVLLSTGTSTRWVATSSLGISGGGGTPGGLNTQIQYNNAGIFGGITGAVTDGTAVSLTSAHLLNPTINGAGVGLATLAYPNTASSATITLPTTSGTLLETTGSGSSLTGIPISVSNSDGTLVISPTTGAVVASRSAITGDVSVPSASNASTLATVNSNVGAFTNANITVNAKGLITAASNGSSGSGSVNSANTSDVAYYSATGTAVSGSDLMRFVPFDATTTGASVLTLGTGIASDSSTDGYIDIRNYAGPSNSKNTYVTAGSTQAGNVFITLPGISSVLVGKTTTDTFTNKTFDTAGTGNVLKINGTAITSNTGTGANVLASSPTIITPTIVAIANLTSNGLVKTSGGTGALSIATAGTDFQAPITLTTTGSGAATFISNTLNIPTPSGGTSQWTVISGGIYNSTTTDSVGIGTTTPTTPGYKLVVAASSIGGILLNTATNLVNAFTIKNASSTSVFNVDTTATEANLAVGTSTSPATATSTLAVVSTGSLDPFKIISSISGTLYKVFHVDLYGHVIHGGVTPTVSTCGTSPAIAGDDNGGTISVSGSVAACTVTFVNAWPATPYCTISINKTGFSMGVTPISSTAFTAIFNSSIGTAVIYYACGAHQ